MAFVAPSITPSSTAYRSAQATSLRSTRFLTSSPCPTRQTRCHPPPCLQTPPPRMVATTPSLAPEDSRASSLETYDVVVIGGGPAGLSLASGLGTRGVRVLCADINLDRPWPNNYGTWVDELEPLGLADCTSHVWPRTAAFVREDGRKSELDRAYARVDRNAMKKRFLDRCERSGNVTVIKAAAREVDVKSETDSTLVSLDTTSTKDGSIETRLVSTRVVVDATGHSLRFVKFNEGKTPGFQAAYGIECVVSEKGYPFDSNEMLLMDFRDDHMQDSAKNRKEASTEPTFIYVMPLDNGAGQHVFFEETSLVASPAMDFDKLKERLYKRLAYYNIEIKEVLDEEFCLIPMGGEMPLLRQRVVAFGGAAALVHPATGYMIARALELADKSAGIIAGELRGGGNADEIAHRVWDRIWNVGRRRQRDFFNFGGEYLQKIDLRTTRDFFAAFFDLPKDQWSAFLSFRLMRPLDRLTFGLGVFARTTNRVRTSIVFDAVTKGRVPLLMSILPLYKVEDQQ
uniref:lycopene beta-cyclase n=1 Tax=Gymnogongrus flabelliformis TaxID=38507 RepID=A0A290WNH1_9FLOR|nr:lycopene beta-cyclase [Ahnfeltiopsis flabelliformis]